MNQDYKENVKAIKRIELMSNSTRWLAYATSHLIDESSSSMINSWSRDMEPGTWLKQRKFQVATWTFETSGYVNCVMSNDLIIPRMGRTSLILLIISVPVLTQSSLRVNSLFVSRTAAEKASVLLLSESYEFLCVFIITLSERLKLVHELILCV